MAERNPDFVACSAILSAVPRSLDMGFSQMTALPADSAAKATPRVQGGGGADVDDVDVGHRQDVVKVLAPSIGAELTCYLFRPAGSAIADRRELDAVD